MKAWLSCRANSNGLAVSLAPASGAHHAAAAKTALTNNTLLKRIIITAII
jgi:hypothetical protein